MKTIVDILGAINKKFGCKCSERCTNVYTTKIKDIGDLHAIAEKAFIIGRQSGREEIAAMVQEYYKQGNIKSPLITKVEEKLKQTSL